VDSEAVTGPVTWDVKLVKRFMLVFDFVTFYALLHVFAAGEAVFQTSRSPNGTADASHAISPRPGCCPARPSIASTSTPCR
jgi:uncharacterized membrane protein